MPNTFAFLVLYCWPVVIIFLFAALPRSFAIAISIIGGYLILPVQTGINLPMLPTLDKSLLPSLFTGIMCLLMVDGRANNARRMPERRIEPEAAQIAETGDMPPRASPMFSRQPVRARVQGSTAGPDNDAALPATLSAPPFGTAPLSSPSGTAQSSAALRAVLLALLALTMISPVATVLSNPEPLFFGPTMLPGLRLYDAASMAMTVGVHMLPFVIGWRYLGGTRELGHLVLVLAIAGLFYSLPALFEVRMSPQLNTWIYGFFQHSFLQHIRQSGYRPIVFLGHGLALSIFLAQTFLAAIALWRARQDVRNSGVHWLLGSAWLFLALVLSKSLGALAIATVFGLILMIAGKRSVVLFAAVAIAFVTIYPVLRGSGLAPVQGVYDFAKAVDVDRAESFKFRLDNEDALLDRANLKPMFGWGSWGRNRIFDPDTGEDRSVTDGDWIITIGVYGWVGYLSKYGLFALPVMALAWRRRATQLTFAACGLCMIQAANILDAIPNATIVPVTWLIAGALAGFACRGAAGVGPAPAQPPRHRQARHAGVGQGRTQPAARLTRTRD
ncbi:hypothetical protein OEW28_04185 [Defluviimonas sp. WL0002]|uniref:O-antigen ligase-like membrane protein n=1 Tax=Albidovulum marisflavi TaxID=2984159 RepID=A0ABT2Z9J7_9RHOB|nr:hypothetical protein [Defluviimonas sp. WL0002]MCV2867818.1 hypothetical protein [Defluviimonas sp. WL0002]